MAGISDWRTRLRAVLEGPRTKWDWTPGELRAARYCGALLVVLLSAFVASKLPPAIFTAVLLLALGVALCAWYFGRGPALFAMAIATVAMHVLIGGEDVTGQGATSPLGRTAAFALASLLLIFFLGSRKTIEESLRRTEKRFALFTQRLPGLAWIKDADGRYVYANDAAAKAFGVEPQKLYGKTDFEIFDEQTANTFRVNDEAALASDSGLFIVESLTHPDGSIHESLVSKFPIRTGANGETMIGGMAIDISDRRRAEAQLRDTEERLRLLIESTSDYSILMLDPNGAVASWNAGGERIHGYTAEEIIGGHASRFYPAEDVEAGLPAALLAQAAAESRARYEGWRARKDGTRFWGVVDLTTLRDHNGELRGFLEVTRDVTEKRKAEIALREADRNKDEFIATLSHELRNPLAPLSNGLEILRMHAVDEQRARQVHDMMDRQVKQLARLIDDLLDVARISTGRVQLRKERVWLDAVVNDAIDSCRPHLDARAQELGVTLPADRVQLDADPARIAQVLLNLLNNASKFTDRCGRIALHAERDGEVIVIRVSDSGIGIPQEQLPRVFEMFYQVDHSLERSYGGMGVGLSLVRALVQLHGGTVECRSEGSGRGSEFIVRLPLPDQEEAASAPAGRGTEESEDVAGSRLRLLVVDDNEDALESFAVLLQDMGNVVRTAQDGPMAIETARWFRPHAVLMDIGLPGMTGYDVARRMRQMPELDDSLLVAVTGWGESDDRRRSSDAGFSHHLVKPVSRATLQQLMATIQGARSTPGTATEAEAQAG